MIKRIIPLMLSCLLLIGCAQRGANEPAQQTVFAMDTVMSLSVYDGAQADALRDAESELSRLDALLDRGAEGSAVYELNTAGAVHSEELAALLTAAAQIARATGGAFDPTIAPVLALWGFGPGGGNYRVPAEDELAAALSAVGMGRVIIDGADVSLPQGVQIDLGGIAKGYAGARVRDIFAKHGVTSAIIDLGGDVCLLGGKGDGSPWRVAVRDPANSESFLGVLEARDRFIVTSGVYERYFEENGVRYHHIIDPATGYPAASGLVSVSVVCADGPWADALATAVSVLGTQRALALREQLRETLPFEFIALTDEGTVYYTDGLAETFAPNSESGYDYALLS